MCRKYTQSSFHEKRFNCQTINFNRMNKKSRFYITKLANLQTSANVYKTVHIWMSPIDRYPQLKRRT